MGLICYSMSFHQVCIPIITKWRNDIYPKIYDTQSYCHWTMNSFQVLFLLHLRSKLETWGLET